MISKRVEKAKGVGFFRGFRGEFEAFAFFPAGIQAGQRNDECIPSLFSTSFRELEGELGLKTTTPPAHRTFSCEHSCSQDEPAPSYSLLREYCGFPFFPRFISLPSRPLRFSSSPLHVPVPVPLHRLFFFVDERDDGGAVAPSAHFLPINPASRGNGRHADDRDSSR